MPIAPLLFATLLASAGHANPIACDLRGDILLAEDGKHVDVSFLGACDEIEDYDQALAVQVEDGEGWRVLGGHWEQVGREEAEGGSGTMAYSVYQQQVACPGEGPTEFRVAWIDGDGAEGWFGERVACVGHGFGCATGRGRAGATLTALAALGLLLPLRRRP